MSVAAATITAPALLPPDLQISSARRRVFEAAIVLFGDRGYHAVSVRDIASQMGLKPMALYSHVASKQELLFEIMLIGYSTYRQRVSEALLDAGREPADQIRALTRAHVMMHLDYPALARVVNREGAALSDDQTSVILRIRDEARQVFVDVIERGQRLGSFTRRDVRLPVTAVAALGIQAAEWWSADSGITAAEVADTYAEFALRILA